MLSMMRWPSSSIAYGPTPVQRRIPTSSLLLLSSPAAAEVSYTAATTPSEGSASGSGWEMKIVLDREGRPAEGEGSHWRSGEQLYGRIKLSAIVGQEQKAIEGLVIRAFNNSVTVWTHSYRTVWTDGQKNKGGLAVGKIVSEEKIEFHRGYVGEPIELWSGDALEGIARSVEGDFPLLEGDRAGGAGFERSLPEIVDGRAVLPFSFLLPTTTRSDTAASFSHAPLDRQYLRDFIRSPPPSVKCARGCIEWVVEALMTVNDGTTGSALDTAPSPRPSDLTPVDLPPTFDSAINYHDPSAHGLLHSRPSLLVERVVFPFEPRDADTQDLYSSWNARPPSHVARLVASRSGLEPSDLGGYRDESEQWEEFPTEQHVDVPQFGRDPRDDSLGGSYVNGRNLQGVLVDQKGGRSKWTTFEKSIEKSIPIKSSILGLFAGRIRSEASVPYPITISRHAASGLPILLHLSYRLPPSSSGKKAKPIVMEKVVLTLSRRTYTRGRDTRPLLAIEELRRQEIVLLNPTNPKLPLVLAPNEPGHDIELEFQMQSEGLMVDGRELTTLRSMSLSVRTPNIEREVSRSAFL